jgi:hypothetical protein
MPGVPHGVLIRARALNFIAASNNGAHPAADVWLLIYTNGSGRRVPPVVGLLRGRGVADISNNDE